MSSHQLSALTPDAMRAEISRILGEQRDQLEDVTPRAVRAQLEQRLGFEKDALEPKKKDIAQFIKEALAAMEGESAHAPSVKSESPLAGSSFASLSAPSAARSTESQRSLNAAKKRALTSAAGDDDEEEEESAAASAKKRKGPAGAASAAGAADEASDCVQLGGMKRVEVRKFKGMVLIDIREMYIEKTSGEERPGKKGISLKADQWEMLLKHAGKINAAIDRA